jgi:hypothetical protein
MVKETAMKKMLSVLLIVGMTVAARSEDVVLRKANGEVFVRHGVAETWTKVTVGDVLKPDDTMKTGKKGSALLLVDGSKRMTLPSEVIVDVSDIRNLSQEELMLKLTMEKVRSSSYEWKNDEMHVPDAAVVHGADRTPSVPLSENTLEVGRFEWNGTKVLFDNGYYSTSALKAMDVLRRYPSLGDKFENLLLVAQALEKANLRGEALSEYVTISQSDKITAEQREVVAGRIAQLRKLSRE